MQAKRGSSKKGCPVPSEGTVGAPKTTKAVSHDSVPDGRVVRITLGDSVQDLGLRGTVVEIDLLGSGPVGFYRRMMADPGGADAENVLTAADLLERIFAELQDARHIQRNHHDLSYWPKFLRLLHTTEQLLLSSRVEGSGPLATILEKTHKTILFALRERCGYNLPIWQGIDESLAYALEWCTGLADEVELALRSDQASYEEPVFGDLSASHTVFRNREDFIAGLGMASRAGLDMNALEVGLGFDGETVCVIRGSLI